MEKWMEEEEEKGIIDFEKEKNQIDKMKEEIVGL